MMSFLRSRQYNTRLALNNLVLIVHCRYLDYAMDRSKIPDQDFFSVVSYLSGNEVALPIVWDWATSNYETLKQRYDTVNLYHFTGCCNTFPVSIFV